MEKKKDNYVLVINRFEEPQNRNDNFPMRDLHDDFRPIEEIKLDSEEVIQIMALISRMRGRKDKC